MHYLTDGRSGTYLCGANAWGRRNTRTDCDENQTTCPRCLSNPDHPGQQTELDIPRPRPEHPGQQPELDLFTTTEGNTKK